MRALSSRAVVLCALGAVTLAAFALAALPARLAFDLAASASGARAGLVQGSVWDAQILRLEVQGVSVAELDAALAPASLLGGAARFDVTVRDPTLGGRGALVLTPGGAVIEDAQGVFTLSRLASGALPFAAGLPGDESVQLQITRLATNRDGACLDADGRITTAALVAAGQAYGVVLPVLEGALFCAGEALAMDLAGATGELALEGRITLSGGEPQWRFQARTSDREAVMALSVLGFDQAAPGVFELDSQRLQPQG